MLTYLTEYQDDNDKCQQRDFGTDLGKARRHARYLTAKDHSLLVYVVACSDEAREGAEAYAYGRRDHADGKMAA